MAGTWTNPKDWVDGETPTGSQFNTQFRDNLKYLKDAPTFDGSPVVNGTVTTNNINVGSDATVGGNLQVNGIAAVNGSMTVYGNTQLGDAITDYVSIFGLILSAPLRNYSETRVGITMGGGVCAVDCNAGTYFTASLTEPVTVMIGNPPPNGRALGITIMFIGQGVAHPVTWQAPVKWPSGIAPTITGTAGKRDIVTLITEDGGATWFGVVAGQNY